MFPVRYINLDKFALQTFNRLAYKQEVSGSPAASCLFSLSNYYNHNISLRHINLNLLDCRFDSIIFYRSKILQSLDNDATFTGFVQTPVCIFKHYWCRGTHFSEFCLYTYFTTILIMKCKRSNRQVFEFKESYPYKLNLIQRHNIKPSSNFFVALIRTLSQYQSKENTVLGSYPDNISW